MTEIEALQLNLQIAVGRLNGLHTVLLVIARSLPSEVAQKAARELRRAAEAVHSDALAMPVPEELIAEQMRVQLELAGVLELAAKSQK
jgi:hypothetical protein